MPRQITQTHSQAILTAVIRSRVRPEELATFVPAACGKVWSFVRAAGLPRPGRHVALYPDARGSAEVGVEVAEPFVGNDRVHCSRLPSGRVVTAVHFGPYNGLGGTHAAIREWCAERGLRGAGICWEIYGHWEEDWNTDPSKIRTDVFHLLDEPEARVAAR
ncbi:MAG: GyrI-like domain-containing protein [Verrucomicrobiota bacterium]